MSKSAEKHLTQDRAGLWLYRRRVPLDLVERVGKKFIKKSLKTDSLRDAMTARDRIDLELDAEWTALRSGGAEYIRAAGRLSPREHIQDLPSDPALQTVLIDNFRRELREISLRDGESAAVDYMRNANPSVANAWLMQTVQRAELTRAGFQEPEITDTIKEVTGEVLDGGIKISKALEMFLTEIAIEITRKHSPAQKKGYEAQKHASVASFIDVCGDIPITDITREHAVKFHKHWQAKVYSKERTAGLGIKRMGDLSVIWSKVADRIGHYERNPFERLTFKEDKRRKQTYDRDWIASKWLQGDGLAATNAELRHILLMLVETGCNPAEILRLPLDRFRLQHNIPHIMVDDLGDDETQRGTVKTSFRIREVPLVGVALPAAQALFKAGGVQRYWDKSNSFSAAANKFLRKRGLQQEKRTVGSLRHAVIEGLKNDAAVSDDLRRAITGHKGNGSHESNYGRFSLDRKLEPLQRIALPFDPAVI